MPSWFRRTLLPVALFLVRAKRLRLSLLFQVETVIHSDGSCDRTIWQPENEMLPAKAAAPA